MPDTSEMLEELKQEYTTNLIYENEDTFTGSKVVDLGESLAVLSMGRLLAVTPKTEDPHDDVDRLCGFMYHMIQTGGRLFNPPFKGKS